MTLLHRATETLRKAEETLRELMAEAASAGDYASVVEIAAWARTTADILKSAPEPAKSTVPSQARVKGRFVAAPVGSVRAPHKSLSDDYPRFFRQEDRLVRVAWSKREKQEYEHKAPSNVLKALAAAMEEQGADGRIFSTDKILPVHDEDGSLIPAYQAYVGIALLKKAGLIDQHGRQGYSVPRLAELRKAVDALWRSLPTK